MRRLAILAISISAMLFFGVNSRAQSTVPKSDTQSWTDVQFTIPLNKKAEFVIIGTLRIGDNVADFVDQRHGVRFNYQIQKYVTLQTSYFHRDAKPPNGRHEREERLMLGAKLSRAVGQVYLEYSQLV